jgi:hypothetical protein
LLVCATLALAGCVSGEHAEDFYVAPGKYVLYDCKQLAGAAAHFEARDKELTQLIARAKEGPGGGWHRRSPTTPTTIRILAS